jgi:hypothetical protein
MNTKNLWIAALSGAVLPTLVSNLPFINLVNCVFFVGFWGSAIFAVWFYRRMSGSITVGEGVRLGALTGLCAGALGFVLSFLGWAGVQGLINELKPFMTMEDLQNVQQIPSWVGITFNLLGVIINVLCGTFGGWIGGLIFRTDRITQKLGAQA